jgi:hypothetical protein
MQALEARLAQLENALNVNTSVFSDSIKVLEAQNEVLRRALQDTFENAPRLVGVDADLIMRVERGRIDYNAYMTQFIAELVEREEAKKEEDAGKGRILLDSSDTDSPIIFGE